MEREKHDRRDTVQNFIIVLLSVAAVLLFAQTQFFSLDGAASLFSTGVESPAAQPTQATQLTDIAMPVWVVVTGTYGRYGSTLMTVDGDFSLPGGILREALGSAGTAETVTEGDFRAALEGTSVYYDFQVPLPLSILTGLTGSPAATTLGSARQLLLSDGQDGKVTLYLSDGSTFSQCTTEVAPKELTDLVNRNQLGNAAFAFELDAAQGLAPYSLFLTAAAPQARQLTASSLSGATDDLLIALAFNPHTNSRYAESNGTEVVMDGDRTLRVRSDGTVTYQDSGGTLQVESADGEILTPEEAVVGSYQLLTALPDWGSGDASLCLRSVSQAGGVTTLVFDYVVQGVRVQLSSGQSAAVVMLTGNAVTSVTLLDRQYRQTETEVSLLPLTQMLAIARNHAGAEIRMCYVDSGAAAVTADWVAN